ncbi:MAG: ClpXP protease specificity-enhancing factor [Gammaproteobacteria bacterium]|jgi:stringent starvation protein B|nr:ClpXP protease specificity-enhancing factor [Gammaproteobacteria bacterium]
MTPNMQPLKPYLIRAYYDWICDSQCTPYLLVQADLPHVQVPEKYIDKEDNTIVLNISAVATNRLALNNKCVQFEARFDEAVFEVMVPYYAVAALYAFENDEGLYFELNDSEIREGEKLFEPPSAIKPEAISEPKKTELPPYLRVVKSDD